jgi:GNAT superfamily N-acetyltransferase
MRAQVETEQVTVCYLARFEGALTSDPSSVRTVAPPEERSALCRRVLEALPDWFGLPDAVERYVHDVAALTVLAVDNTGFLALKVHTDTAAEIYVMGVMPEHHHAGIGSALVAAADDLLRETGIEYLQVKTLGPSAPDEHYAATRRFYEARGFRPLEELTEFWDEENPCLIMVKRL